MSHEVAGSPCVTAVSIRSLKDDVTGYRLALERRACRLQGVHREVSPLHGHSGVWTIEAQEVMLLSPLPLAFTLNLAFCLCRHLPLSLC